MQKFFNIDRTLTYATTHLMHKIQFHSFIKCVKRFLHFAYPYILYSPVTPKSVGPSFTDYIFKSKITMSFIGSFQNTLGTFQCEQTCDGKD